MTVTKDWISKAEDREVWDFPTIKNLDRKDFLLTMSTHRQALADFLAVSRKDPDRLVSTVGADWLAEKLEALDETLDALVANNQDELSIALGKLSYVVGKRKSIVKCLISEDYC